jgi:hypothetical protein
VSLGKAAGVPQDELLQPLEEVVLRRIALPAPQSEGGDLVGPGRPADARSMRPGKSASSILKRSATASGAWFGSMTPPEPTRMRFVTAAIWPIITSGAGLATDARLWCSAVQ